MPSLPRLPTLPRMLAVPGLVAAVTVLAGLATVPAQADDGALPSGRHVEHYTVRAGDTASGLAVRFHAWTAELVDHNHLGSGAGLTVGQRLEIPVVTSAVPRQVRPERARRSARPPAPRRAPASAGPSRAAVRAEIVRAARSYGVDPHLALAVSWQEAGWQMHHVSSAGAIGAMQVLPSTGEWMEYYAGRPLHLRTLRDNVAAGVLLLDVLRDMTGSRTRQVAAYYQGVGAVQEHGLYTETRPYVANVRAIEERLERGLPPA